MRAKGSIAILTGAGLSAESGLATFRASDGMWCGQRVENVATPEGFAANPALVHDFYNQRRAQLKSVAPNAAHLALARLAAYWPDPVLIITQNVDDLHDRAALIRPPHPSSGLIHMHGELKKARHLRTHQVIDCNHDLDPYGDWRPHIVWFGEMPFEMEKISDFLKSCAAFVSIGTSGNVYPAAGFVATARAEGAETLELNLEPSMGGSLFHQCRLGPATRIVPEWVDSLIGAEDGSP